MTSYDLSSLDRFQQLIADGETLTDAQQREYEHLARAFAVEQQSRADDKSTWLVDESRRPQLNGTDYNDTLKRMCCDEVETVLRKGLETLGRAALKVVVERVMG